MVSFKTLSLAVAASAVIAAPANQQSTPNFPDPNTNAWVEGAHESMVNHQQVVETYNRQMQLNPSQPHNADRIIAAITGADSQIDNAIATVAHALAPFTGGLSLAVGNALLGPFAQSVTNGAEVLIGNLVGGAEDRMQTAAAAYTTRLTSLRAQAVRFNVNTSRLDHAITQLQARLSKSN
ncbi:uncharacterized protein SAPINGB_P001049 [Magnusiomyces paraingens]|uniref:Uncharacterized protein n=1 Tax=Magnusiomyces paraingens TaxID=2606893 RepID=A0A5E8B5L4_9ASCO|nr:uncharacterized protein SAPINGB_P001048 [Saprochaete ingens]XP_031851663.1 uncharacterized protein SAPINGB_P001049 [Saprochaete ingens]VVT46104.1 unnamed protein product [Saprochaete ingens]VVT46106.1 unnamed protein product [Saprochaete ingens]